MSGSEPELRAAGKRLRGHLVATPVIGDLHLPGFPSVPGLRLKADQLQPAGTSLYRGAMHYLMRQMGRCKGLALGGGPHLALAVALAGRSQRLPVVSFWNEPPDAALGERLAALHCEVRAVGAEPESSVRAFCADSGYRTLAVEDPDFAAGVATLGLELADELPTSCPRVLVATGFGAAVVAGLRVGGRGEVAVREVAVGPAAESQAALSQALVAGHRLVSDPAGLAVLAAALAEGTPESCAVLTS